MTTQYYKGFFYFSRYYILLTLPSCISRLLEPKSLFLKTQGRIGDTLYYGQLRSGEPAYLKVGSGYSANELNREAKILQWLKGNLIAPQLIEFQEIDRYSYLLILEIKGQPLHKASNLRKIQAVAILAKALQMIHELPVGFCPFKNVLAYEIEEIERFVKENRINVALFSKNNKGKMPEDVLKRLKSIKNDLNQNIVTHGDFCLPNVLVKNNDVSGVVDWSKCGIADHHRDFSALDGSIKRNLGEKYIFEFYNAYGINPNDIDLELINFYKLIDQFHYYVNIN